MTKYAVINENVVVNLILADSVEIAEQVTGHTCIECTDLLNPNIGYLWDGDSFTVPETPIVEDEPVETPTE
jgi:hypothetical protein